MEESNIPAKQDEGQHNKHYRVHPCTPLCSLAAGSVLNTQPSKHGVGSEKQSGACSGQNTYFGATLPGSLLLAAESAIPVSTPLRRAVLRSHLTLLVHATECTHDQNSSNGSLCYFPHCRFYKGLLRHIEICPNEGICPCCGLCTLSRECLTHWKACSQKCGLCSVAMKILRTPVLHTEFVQTLWSYCIVCLTHSRERLGSKLEELELLKLFKSNLEITN